MKKLIAISVVFALVAGAAFAVDVGANVIGSVKVLQGNTGKDDNGDSNKVTGGGGMKHIRIDGSGEANENFGGYFRIDSEGALNASGNAWWKPVDQFKLLIGGNGGDGFYGKEGITGWMFYQTVTDTKVAFEGGSVWGGSVYSPVVMRHAFFGGDNGGNNLRLEITPMEILGINLTIPFIEHDGDEVADIFKQTIAQIDLNLEGIGNIALTYRGGLGYKEASSDYKAASNDAPAGSVIFKGSDGNDYYFAGGTPTKVNYTAAVGDPGYNEKPGSIFVYYGGSFGDLSIDFGLGYHLAEKKVVGTKAESYNQPVGIGLGVKYAMETLGVKFRTVVSIPMEDDQGLAVLADFLPYFVINDNMTAFVGFGLGMAQPSKDGKEKDEKSVTGWQFNPYLQVGEEWGAKFLFGIKVWSDGNEYKNGKKVAKDGSKVTNWDVPIALIVSF